MTQQIIELNMNQHEKKMKPGNPNWKPGQSGNPRGRPVGSRQKIAEQLLSAFALILDEDPVTALRQLKADDPGKFWTIAAGLLPRETLVSVQQAAPGGLSPDDWPTLQRILDLIERHVPEGVAPGQIFEFIEHALRAEFAKPVIAAPPY